MKKYFLPIVLVVASLLLGRWIMSSGPEAHRVVPEQKALLVDVQTVSRTDYQVQLTSYGIVQPRVEGTLIAQVSGTIVKVSPQFVEGGFFQAGDILVEIDDRDYRVEVTIAEGNLAQAQLALDEEIARVEQAEKDWKSVRRAGENATDLTLRKPHLTAAKAALQSAQANLVKARLDFERTKIRAPYTGRVRTKQVDVGQYVSSNTQLAEIFDSTKVEVRLPLNSRQLGFAQLPGEVGADRREPVVRIQAQSGTESLQWQGTLVRAEGAIDSESRQRFVIAEIQDPFSLQKPGGPVLQVGQFVEASIEGKRLPQVYVIPRALLYPGDEVYLLQQGKIIRKQLPILWYGEKDAVTAEGLQPGDLLVSTPLGSIASGTLAKVRE